jgi:uncharacterized protein Yka (UPF0111/DUF47 family)
MLKKQAVASLGHRGLLMPVWVKAALAANDRLKVYLTVLQASAARAAHPDQEPPDLSSELRAAGLASASWLHDMPAGASAVDGALLLPELPALVTALSEDLAVMARPVLEACTDDVEPHARVRQWQDWLAVLKGEQLDRAQLRSLTHGQRHGDDSLHLLVMDLHKAINRLSAELASEVIDGAHVWQIDEADRVCIRAFMRGLNRTAPLKFDHPGLDTAATRDGPRLLLQNDIGTNDAHVLVIQIEGRHISLTYSDLHRSRFAFFQAMLGPLGGIWSGVESRQTAELNEGKAYTVGTVRFEPETDAALEATLEGIGARIVYLIDWNRARKRLLHFVDKVGAVAVLTAAAEAEAGHMGWLKAGGEHLIWQAMQDVDQGAFRIGDRLDEVLGAEGARHFLVDVLVRSSEALRRGEPAALLADEARMLLSRMVHQRGAGFDLLEEHAAWCHALAQGVSDVLLQGHDGLRDAAGDLAARAKAWERRADHLVMQARQEAERRPRLAPVVRLLSLSDDVADALEEAAFLMGLVSDHHQQGWNAEVRQALSRLAQTVLQAVQEHVKALAIARTLDHASETNDTDAFLAATWNVVRAEKQCDELLRHARREILRSVHDAPALMLANDLALSLELASDRLLAAGYALRALVLDQSAKGA